MVGVKDKARLKTFPLISYAALHWVEHAQSIDSSDDIFDLSYSLSDSVPLLHLTS